VSGFPDTSISVYCPDGYINTSCPARCGHWSSVWPWSADGVSRPSDCSISSSCRSRSVNSIARRRNWCATAERRCSSCARRSSRSMVFTISQSALPCTPLPRGCRRRVRGSSGSSLRWLFLLTAQTMGAGAPGDRRPTAAEHVLEDLHQALPICTSSAATSALFVSHAATVPPPLRCCCQFVTAATASG
jgi:hypothetical protein